MNEIIEYLDVVRLFEKVFDRDFNENKLEYYQKKLIKLKLKNNILNINSKKIKDIQKQIEEYQNLVDTKLCDITSRFEDLNDKVSYTLINVMDNYDSSKYNILNTFFGIERQYFLISIRDKIDEIEELYDENIFNGLRLFVIDHCTKQSYNDFVEVLIHLDLQDECTWKGLQKKLKNECWSYPELYELEEYDDVTFNSLSVIIGIIQLEIFHLYFE